MPWIFTSTDQNVQKKIIIVIDLQEEMKKKEWKLVKLCINCIFEEKMLF